jgi:hypothetical protein
MKKIILSIALLFNIYAVTAQEMKLQDIKRTMMTVKPSQELYANIRKDLNGIKAAKWALNYYNAFALLHGMLFIEEENVIKERLVEVNQLLSLENNSDIAILTEVRRIMEELDCLKLLSLAYELKFDRSRAEDKVFRETYTQISNEIKSLNTSNPRMLYADALYAYFMTENRTANEVVLKNLTEIKTMSGDLLTDLDEKNMEKLEGEFPRWGKQEAKFLLELCKKNSTKK